MCMGNESFVKLEMYFYEGETRIEMKANSHNSNCAKGSSERISKHVREPMEMRKHHRTCWVSAVLRTRKGFNQIHI